FVARIRFSSSSTTLTAKRHVKRKKLVRVQDFNCKMNPLVLLWARCLHQMDRQSPSEKVSSVRRLPH
ncbi:hypothetical protein, partial [Pseudomonas syringae group genomosp. 3]|uniref:hypothetical protein n=1 Tax=Pseudomonas syringae group genomosp. 3 TaxID=251701 RepID=UPI001C81C58D